MVRGNRYKTIRWRFLESLEPPRIVQVRCTSMVTEDNIYGQVTVRMHTKQVRVGTFTADAIYCILHNTSWHQSLDFTLLLDSLWLSMIALGGWCTAGRIFPKMSWNTLCLRGTWPTDTVSGDYMTRLSHLGHLQKTPSLRYMLLCLFLAPSCCF